MSDLPEPRTNGLAVASLVVSVVGLVSCWGGLFIGPVGAILGHRALAAIRRNPGVHGNRGLALAGVIVGWIAFALGLLSVLYFFLTAPAQTADMLGGIFGIFTG